MPVKNVPTDLDLDFDTEHGVPPHFRTYPNMNPPPDHDAKGVLWPEPTKVEVSFFIDRNVDTRNRKELAYAVRTQAWRRLTNLRFEDDPRTLPYRYYHVQFIFCTQTPLDWWIHVFILRMMNEMAG
ncbi:uncharacterized protein LDX57_012047 [Aspergillus melleus]|uniref:uncharacterized protein n=1 Tax=Aspergillus melleus TaxID=138277 RepID=UPI001E8D1384|nr:uncharacterized protein LDX57_012047 [Aspergillus melleus]KAH8434400.1 hypothetical protein LDX57_012047 [Aspergillus melleus]